MEDHLIDAMIDTGRYEQLVIEPDDRGSNLGLEPVIPGSLGALDWRQVVGGVLVLAGVIALLVGWWGVSGTSQEWKELPYLVSGGLGGIMMIGLGVTLFVSYEHSRDREALRKVLRRLTEVEGAVHLNGSRGEDRAGRTRVGPGGARGAATAAGGKQD